MNKSKLLLLPLLFSLTSAQAVQHGQGNNDFDGDVVFDLKSDAPTFEELKDSTSKAYDVASENIIQPGLESAKNIWNLCANVIDHNIKKYQKNKEGLDQAPAPQAAAPVAAPAPKAPVDQPVIKPAPAAVQAPAPAEVVKRSIPSNVDPVLEKVEVPFVLDDFNATFVPRLGFGFVVDRMVRTVLPKTTPIKRGILSFVAQAGIGAYLFDAKLANIGESILHNTELQKEVALYAAKAGATYLAAQGLNTFLDKGCAWVANKYKTRNSK